MLSWLLTKHCSIHLAKQVLEEISTNETYKHAEDNTIEKVQDGHAEWMMQENLAELSGRERLKCDSYPRISKVVFQTTETWSLNQTPQTK